MSTCSAQPAKTILSLLLTVALLALLSACGGIVAPTSQEAAPTASDSTRSARPSHTDSLSEAGGPAESYIALMR